MDGVVLKKDFAYDPPNHSGLFPNHASRVVRFKVRTDDNAKDTSHMLSQRSISSHNNELHACPPVEKNATSAPIRMPLIQNDDNSKYAVFVVREGARVEGVVDLGQQFYYKITPCEGADCHVLVKIMKEVCYMGLFKRLTYKLSFNDIFPYRVRMIRNLVESSSNRREPATKSYNLV